MANASPRDAVRYVDYLLKDILRTNPIIGIGSSVALDQNLKFTQAYNSTQTEYKVDFEYRTTTNQLKHIGLYVRTGEYSSNGKVEMGPVQTIATLDVFDPRTGRFIPKKIKEVPGTWID